MNNQEQDSLLLLAEQYFQARKYPLAKPLLKQIILSSPLHSRANELLAYIAGNAGDTNQSYELLKVACQSKYSSSTALYYLGSLCLEKGLLSDAIDNLKASLEKAGSYFEGLHDLATAQALLGLNMEALINYQKALEFNKNSPELFFNIARLYDELGELNLALTNYDEAIKLNPNYAEAWCNRGIDLRRLFRFSEAKYSFGRALEIKPDFIDAWISRGVTFFEASLLNEALHDYDQALLLNPNNAIAWVNKAAVLHDLNKYEDAIEAYSKALKLDLDLPYVFTEYLHAKMKIADWSNYEMDLRSLYQQITENNRPSTPFAVVVMSSSEEINFRAAKNYVLDKFPPLAFSPMFSEASKKIKIGYFSNDYFNHATAYLMAELIELHNRDQFEIIAFSFGQTIGDKMQLRLQNAFDQFIDVSKIADSEVATLSRKMGIDIAIDLKGFTRGARPGIFAHYAAPIQVNYLGYPGSMGAEYIDYIIADKILIPKENQQFFAEKIVYLPHSYQVNDSKRTIADIEVKRADYGLPDDAFVFCCFNNTYKITPDILDSWIRILNAVEGSVIWLLEDNAVAKRNLIRQAENRGLVGNRLVFSARAELATHLARHQLADLFLDTLPCGAHTTASDALWTGLPVLTQIGQTFAGRVSASLLLALDIPELITESQDQYERMAIELASSAHELDALRAKLKRNRDVEPLFNTKFFVKNLESAYHHMHQRHQMQVDPGHMYIDSEIYPFETGKVL